VPASVAAGPVDVALDTTTDVVDGEVLVTWREDLDAGEQAQARDELDLELEGEVALTDAEKVELPNGVDVSEAVVELADDPRVASVQPNYRYARAGNLWGLNNTGQTILGSKGIADVDIDATNAWGITQGSSSVVVAVIDTGVQITHSDLDANIWVNGDEIPGNGIDDDGNGYTDDVNGWDFVYNNRSVYDGERCTQGTSYTSDDFNNDDHGTHVAGTIAAEANTFGVIGAAPGVKVMVLKTIGCAGGDTESVTSALAYAKANGADVANMSLGGASPDPLLKAAIDNAGMLVVAAAGNGRLAETSGICRQTGGDPVRYCPMYPAAFSSSNIVSVASINNRGALSDFSQYGSVGPNGSTSTGVDLAAPGEDIVSTFPDGYGASAKSAYAYLSGTSMAAPHVSGTAALVLSRFPSLTTSQLKQRLLDRTKPLSSLDGGVTVKGGIVHAGGALGLTKASKAVGSSVITIGSSTTVASRLTAGSNLSGQRMTLRRYVPSSNTWVTQCIDTTSGSGSAVCAVKPTATTTYEWRYAGTGTPGTLGWLSGAWSGQITVRVKAKVGLGLSDTTPRRGQKVTFAAAVAPNKAGQKVALQRYTDSGWVRHASATLNGDSRRVFTVTPTKRGTTLWRIYYHGDSKNSSATSTVRSLRTS
jgi:subtilisin family serine protease